MPTAQPSPDNGSRRHDIESIVERLEEHEEVVEAAFRNTHLMTQQVARLGMQVEHLAGDVRRMREDIPAMLMQSAIAIVGNPAVWEAARTAMRGQARDAAGSLLLGWLGGVAKAGFWGLVFLVLLWQFSGWNGVWQWIRSH